MKFFFFDLDGTLRQPKSGAKFINKPEDQEPIPGTQEAVKYYHSKGFVCIGVTNQGGVAAGHKSLEDAIAEQLITLELFPELYSVIFCPDYEGKYAYRCHRNMYHCVAEKYPDLQGTYRKPGDGMIRLALIESETEEVEDCWMVGDRPEDQQCAANAGVNFIWADIMHAKFDGKPGMKEIDPQHLSKEDLLKFLSL